MPVIVPSSGRKKEEKRTGPVWDFFRNAITDVREVAPGLILGPLMLGRDVVMDVGSVAKGDFDFDRTGRDIRGMVQGFGETSPLVPLVQLDVPEAASRFHERPVTGLLDLTGAAGLLAGGGARAARGLAYMTPSKASRRSLMNLAGYERVGEVGKVNIAAPKPTLQYKFAPGVVLGKDVFARPTHRRVLPSFDSPTYARDPFTYDPSDFSRADLAERDLAHASQIESIDVWKRLSPNPLWRSLNESQAALRRNIPSAKPLSSDKQIMRRQRRGTERLEAKAYSRASDMHAGPNKALLNAIASTLRDRNIRDIDIEEVADLSAYYAGLGYSSVAHRMDDLRNTHEGGVQSVRAQRKLEDSRFYSSEADVIRNQIEQMKNDGVDMDDPRVDELRRQQHVYYRNAAKARQEASESLSYLDQREMVKTISIDPSNPLSGYAYEMQQLDRHGALIDEVMKSEAMEKWLDAMELARDDAEAFAIRNYGLGLTPKDALRNLYRQADLYQPDGVTERTMALYNRARMDGRGARRPLFMPMMEKKRASLKKDASKDFNPFAGDYQSMIGDPMALELRNHNLRAPITKGIIMRKHMMEMLDFERSRLVSNARRLAVPMPRKLAEQWRRLDRHEGGSDLTIIKPNGRLQDPNAGFVDIGEYGAQHDQFRFALQEMANELRTKGHLKAANMTDNLATEIAVTYNSNVPRSVITGEQSVKDIENMRGMADEMTTILPTSVYASINDYMIRTAGLVQEVAGAPSAMKSFEKSYGNLMKYWRYSVLHTRPKWMFNNAIGSIYMLAMQEGWLPAFANILRNSSLFNWSKELLGVDRKMFESGGSRYLNELVEKKMSDVLYAAGSTSMFGGPTNVFGFSNRNLSKVERFDRMMDWVADFNAKVADNPARSARIMTLLDEMVDAKISEAEALGKPLAASRDDLRIEILNDIEARERLAERVLEDMIDFQDLSSMERKLIAWAIPFYSWIKGSTKATMRNIADHPARMGWQRYMGMEAQDQLREQFPGGIPSYLMSALPGGWSGEDPRGIVNFAGASPASVLGDALVIGTTMAGGAPQQFGTESVLGMLNPFFNAGIAATTYKNPFYGTAIKSSELPPMAMWESVQPPLWRALHRAGVVPKSPLGGGMYEPSGRSVTEFNPYVGLQQLISPVQQNIVPMAAAERYKEERASLGY